MAPKGRQDPPQNGGQLGPQKNDFLRPKLAPILGGSWRPRPGSRPIFLRPNMAPCWLHVDDQHGFMLGGNMSPIFDPKISYFWNPTWLHVGSILTTNMDSCWVPTWDAKTPNPASKTPQSGLQDAPVRPPRRSVRPPRRLSPAFKTPKNAQSGRPTPRTS